MRQNNELKLHVINVNHGDATIVEFPDYGTPRKTAHFAVIDFGAKLAEDRALTRDYMKALIEVRKGNTQDLDYAIDFICVTHPHDDHYGGLKRFMDEYADPDNAQNNKILNFWDCGFRTTSTNYNRVLTDVIRNPNLTFTRVASGSEFEFGDVRIIVLAPSVDLRNRYDTYGVDKNNASIVLRIKYRNSYIILAADAEFASWGKTTEEFPRQVRINFHHDALGLADRNETAEQLKCNLLRVSHHGSKHGTSLEYLERLKPRYVVVPAGNQQWYHDNILEWENYFPHPLVTAMFQELDRNIQLKITGEVGNMIFKYKGRGSPRRIDEFLQRSDSAGFVDVLKTAWEK